LGIIFFQKSPLFLRAFPKKNDGKTDKNQIKRKYYRIILKRRGKHQKKKDWFMEEKIGKNVIFCEK
jgi:hypothetical protein